MIPEKFAESTIAREGDRGRAWIAELPSIVDDVLSSWNVEPDGATMHGEVGIVIPVAGDRVVKISFPHPGNDYEADAFEAWGGRGAVRLHQHDDARYALLLERTHAEQLIGLEDNDQIPAVAGELSKRLTIAAPDHLPRLSDRADEWYDEVRSGAAEFPDALPTRVVDAALDVVDELGREQPELVVHGDFHARNILRADREPWLAVDPKGYVGDPAYDGGTLLLPRVLPYLDSGDLATPLQRELEIFAEAADLDRDRIRRWAQLRCVQGSYYGRRNGFGRARSGVLLDRLVAAAEQLAIAWA
ncbi:aminoglycoside phosphotransferase family protein [Kribbella sp. NPDC004875]|uniref:aminoglycoside phosphotransferase family protein n=1 Tax=Kribbella sp. NPDC004875 TaxID=3364107 RepID=UPI0036C368BC